MALLRLDGALAKALAKPASAVAVVPRLRIGATSSDEDLVELSERMRAGGASALLLYGDDLRHVQLILDEQRSAVGHYPGPLPILFEPAGDAAASHSDIIGCGAAAVVSPLPLIQPVPPSAPPLPPAGESGSSLLLVPRCCSQAELAEATASSSDWPLVLADDGAAESIESLAAEGGNAAVIMASLDLGEDMAGRARALRAQGCAAVVVDFDVDDWPAPPEAILGAVLSKKSPVMGSLGLKVGFGTFQSDQYWLNKKFKEAKNMASKREKKYGTSEIRKTSDGL